MTYRRLAMMRASVDSQEQPSRGVLRKKYFEKIHQIYRRTPMLKCDYNKVVKQLY